jgi:hypothetical protein
MRKKFCGCGPLEDRRVELPVRRTEAKAKENNALNWLVIGELNWLRIMFSGGHWH